MIAHYLSTALRNFWRYKSSATVNVLGLSVAFAVFLVAFGYTTIIQNGDRSFKNADRIGFITQGISLVSANVRVPPTVITSGPVGEYLRTDYPELAAVARVKIQENVGVMMSGAEKAFMTVWYADPDFFKIFALPSVDGRPAVNFSGPRSAVMTQKAARKLGPDVAVGSVVSLSGSDVTVTGIVDTLPQPSHFYSPYGDERVDIFVSMDVYEKRIEKLPSERRQFSGWGNFAVFTYALLPERGLTFEAFNEKLKTFGAAHAPSHMGIHDFHVQPISKFTLLALNAVTGASQAGISGDAMIMLLAALVVAVACLNYANMTAARAIGRLREIGLRKVLGARRGQILRQHLFEAGVQTGGAMVGVLLILGLAAPIINSTFGFNVVHFIAAMPVFWGVVGGTTAIATLLAGLYPAFILSRMEPSSALRASGARAGSKVAPTILVGMQFAATSFLIIAVFVMQMQNVHMQHMTDQKSPDALVSILTSIDEARINLETFRAEVLNIPGVKGVSAAQFPPWSFASSNDLLKRSSDVSEDPLRVGSLNVSYDYFSTVGTKVLAGRVFSPEYASDVVPFLENLPATEPPAYSVIIGQSLASQLGGSPAEAVGKTLYRMYGLSKDALRQPLTVVGVVEDRPMKIVGGLSSNTSNVFFLMPASANFPVIRISRQNTAETLARIDDVWSRLAPTVPVRRQMSNELFEQGYEMFAGIGRIFTFLAGFSFLIAVIGLSGMAIYAIGRRTREIGVRKTLGSTSIGVVRLFLWDFSKPIIVANIVAWPMAFLVMKVYLGFFVSRVALTPLPFVAGLAATLVIGWIAVGGPTWRAARVSPADVLHYE